MAKSGSSYRKMQAVRKARQRKTDAFTKKLCKFLVAMANFTALMFKYMFIALWWVIKYMFKLMYTIFVYIYRGIVFLAKKVSKKFCKKENIEK